VARTPNSSAARAGRPPVTSRAEILDSARRLIDRDGWEKLTVRKLAGEMGIGATTLYHHVRDKQDLLLLLLNEYVVQIPEPDLPIAPRERILVAATAMHDALAEWPWAAEVLTADGFLGVLDESALWMVETIVAGAVEEGCTQAGAVDLFRSIWYLMAGEILVRAHSDRERPGGKHPPSSKIDFSRFDPSRLPRLAEIGEQWPALAARETYPETLAALVDGLLRQGTSADTESEKR
jgi:AcrR family transcriptional regulator